MDDDILKNNVDDVDKFIKSFDDGKYPTLGRVWLNGTRYDTIEYENWKFLFDGSTLRDENIDFIVQKWEVKFWFWHSYISWWKNIDFAWNIRFDSDGIPYSWSNNSWHYKSISNDKAIFIIAMKEKYWFNFSDVYYNNIVFSN